MTNTGTPTETVKPSVTAPDSTSNPPGWTGSVSLVGGTHRCPDLHCLQSLALLASFDLSLKSGRPFQECPHPLDLPVSHSPELKSPRTAPQRRFCTVRCVASLYADGTQAWKNSLVAIATNVPRERRSLVLSDGIILSVILDEIVVAQILHHTVPGPDPQQASVSHRCAGRAAIATDTAELLTEPCPLVPLGPLDFRRPACPPGERPRHAFQSPQRLASLDDSRTLSLPRGNTAVIMHRGVHRSPGPREKEGDRLKAKGVKLEDAEDATQRLWGERSLEKVSQQTRKLRYELLQQQFQHVMMFSFLSVSGFGGCNPGGVPYGSPGTDSEECSLRSGQRTQAKSGQRGSRETGLWAEPVCECWDISNGSFSSRSGTTQRLNPRI
ncbi:hypothetical protein AAFF_G00408160 [Aldrovandia affinis]|uniref:Uncharacterized protein n=1 Tax=Aldrovandia affinis TaxID=143900 RepID=A0AAD7SE53_9TELE|nr:hypothetical protein AAFF_G00408160 [Aldrovandia affinis]